MERRGATEKDILLLWKHEGERGMEKIIEGGETSGRKEEERRYDYQGNSRTERRRQRGKGVGGQREERRE